ncbi:hypothetical protein DFH94DRAFT_807587 [Russula ochroleuca]|uniref:Uncharacterized protein n=1 Tax=Russula ochroleuca TaxID=152965 RepID=A0A9P5JZ75_9AGAM|nr:hypothetical protein DFH94DRAFT_807587 [Russula ochroleuca]
MSLSAALIEIQDSSHIWMFHSARDSRNPLPGPVVHANEASMIELELAKPVQYSSTQMIRMTATPRLQTRSPIQCEFEVEYLRHVARRYPPFENSYQERARKSDDTKVTLEEFEDENSPQNLSAWHQTIPAQFSNFCGVPSVSGPSKKISTGRYADGIWQGRNGRMMAPFTSPQDIRMTGDFDESANALCILYRKGVKNRDQPTFKC